MAENDAPGTVTIYNGGFSSLHADDHGLTLRNGARVRRFAWAEVSGFADGVQYGEGTYWCLLICLHSGQEVKAHGTPTPETLAAIRQVAARYGIPADVAGIPAADGGPAERGFYEDPGGRAGLRFWNGAMWSPLLPPEVSSYGTMSSAWLPPGVSRSFTAPKGPASWAALPMADGSSDYFAVQARRQAGRLALAVAVSAAALIWGLVTGQWWGAGFVGVIFVLQIVFRWNLWKLFVKLGEVVKGF
jgi:hypothetical protein